MYCFYIRVYAQLLIKIRYFYRLDYIVNDVTRKRLRFIQIPPKRLKKDTSTQVNKSTFIFIADKVFGFPVKL